MKLLRRHSSWLLPLGAGVLIIALWYVLRSERLDWKLSQPFILATPDEIFRALLDEREVLWVATKKSGLGALLGLGSAALFGFLVALVLSLSKAVRAALYPYLMVLQMTPIIVVAPIILLLIGATLTSVVTITLLMCFFPIVVNTTQGLVSTDRNLVDLFRLSNATRWQELVLLRIPAAAPDFFTGLRIAATLAPVGSIVGDFYAGNTAGGGGLGYCAYVFSSQANTPALYATGVVSCLLGFVFVACVLVLERAVLSSWHAGHVREE